MENGSHAEALGLASRALAAARANRTGDIADYRMAVARVHQLIGEIHSDSGNKTAAQAAWGAGLSVWPKGIEEKPLQMAIRAEMLTGLGRTAEAKPLIERLAAIGYRKVI